MNSNRQSASSTISTSSTSTCTQRISAGTSATVYRVRNSHDPYRPWCVRWRTATMPADAHWYYSSQGEAIQVAEKLTQRCTRG